MSTVKRVFGVVVVGLLLAAFGAQSAFGHEGDGLYGADCSGPNAAIRGKISVCGVVTNRIQGFDAHGGHVLGNQTLQITEILENNVTTYGGGAAYKDGAESIGKRWNMSWWQWFDGLRGITSFGPAGGALNTPVSVTYDWKNMNGRDEGTFTMTCPEQTYLVCQTPEVYSNKVFREPANLEGYASIESRPLIIKIINQTDQPLVRSSEARTTGLLRDNQVADPETISAMHNGHVGNGHYHFYRDSSQANNATVSYTFAAGTEGTALTDSVLEINIVVDLPPTEAEAVTAVVGDATKSTCRAPEGLDVTVQCAVTTIGSADGIITAIVSIGA